MDDAAFNEDLMLNAKTPRISGREGKENHDRPLRSDPEFMGFDKNAGSNYVYPNSTDKYPFREYQYKICKEAFFQNTLVVLPDGLGKSFIASVVMYNIYRWYPMSKVIFLSASKSILKGQMEACWNIMNIPKGDCVEITGKSPSARVDIWKKYRVIFGTPRQILSDFREVNSLPFLRIKLLVITEAHKARGSNNPFAHIIDILHGQNEYFRILAHTSVIGKKTSEIAEVVRHLRISHVEIRQENSPDIAEYVRKNTIKPLEVEINEEFRTIKDEFLTSIDPFLRTLLANVNVPGTLSKSRLITAKKKFTEASMTEKHTNYAHVISTFDICIDLYHAVELLDDYGIVSFMNYLESEVLMESPKAGDEKLREFIEKLKGTFQRCLLLSETENGEMDDELHDNIVSGHPKIAVMERVILEHFQKNVESRLIIFSNCPKTSSLIHQCLRQKCPQMRCMVFRGGHEMSENERNCTRLKFIRGTINTIITSQIPDEGVVNEVDLIICYDTNGRHLKQFIRSRVSSCGGGKKCDILVVAHEGADMVAHSELWRREKGDLGGGGGQQDINRNPIILAALSDQSPRLVPVEYNPVNLTPSLLMRSRVERPRGTTRNIADYFKNVPQKTQCDPGMFANSPPSPLPVSRSTTAPALITLPTRTIIERVEGIRMGKLGNLGRDENLENIIKGSYLAAKTQEFLREMLGWRKVCDGQGKFFEFLKRNSMTVVASSQQHQLNYFALIVGNVTKKLNGYATVDEIGGKSSEEVVEVDEEETFFDISDLNVGFIGPEEEEEEQDDDDGDLTRKSICGETTLSFYLISSLEGLFESDASGWYVFEMGMCGRYDIGDDKMSEGCGIARNTSGTGSVVMGGNVSDGEEEEVIPSSQDNIPFSRQQRVGTRCRRRDTVVDVPKNDGHSGEDVECNPGLQLGSISSTDTDNKFNFGTIDDIFGNDGSIFERDLLSNTHPLKCPPIPSSPTRHDDDDEYPRLEFTSPSVLSGRRVNFTQLKHSNNNANDLAQETHTTCINPISPCRETAVEEGGNSSGRRSSREFFATCHDGDGDGLSSDTQRDEVFGTCDALNSRDVVAVGKKSKGTQRRRLRSNFIQFEAAAGSDDDDDDDREDETEDANLLDSIVVESSDDEQIEQLNRVNDMQAMYLQSVRSPIAAGAFRIPNPARYRSIEDVFSQTQPPEVSEYMNDSFVVDEADESDSDLSILGEAEAILRARKRPKGIKGWGQRAKKSRIVAPIDDSSEDDDLHELRREAGDFIKVVNRGLFKDKNTSF